MTIKRNRIATISEWKNNCSVAVMGDFMADMLRQNKLSHDAVAKLLRAFQNYYGIAVLNKADLLALLSNEKYFSAPNDSQEILGCMLRSFLQENNQDASTAELLADGQQLTPDAFATIATWFGFGVKFYMLEQAENAAEIKEMPALAINKDLRLQLQVMWHNCVDIKASDSLRKRDFHFDRIMPTAMAAALHDSQMSAQISLSATGRQLQRDDEVKMKQQICDAVAEIQLARKSSVIVPLVQKVKLNVVEDKSWQEFVEREINHLASAGDEVVIIDEAAAFEAKEKALDVFTADKESRKIIYSLWGSKAAIVDAATQEKWDRELAERLREQELAAPSLKC
jgi:hypothetical protein